MSKESTENGSRMAQILSGEDRTERTTEPERRAHTSILIIFERSLPKDGFEYWTRVRGCRALGGENLTLERCSR